MKLTDKERIVLSEILDGSLFNTDRIDISKDWESQELEDSSCYWSIADAETYGKGMNSKATGAIFGSLMRKGLIGLVADRDMDGKHMSWIVIERREFDAIKIVLG